MFPAGSTGGGASMVNVSWAGVDAIPDTACVTDTVWAPRGSPAGNGTVQVPPATRTNGARRLPTEREPVGADPADPAVPGSRFPSTDTVTSAPFSPVP